MQLKSPLVSRKPLQPDNKKHPDEDDACSVVSMYPLKNVLFEVSNSYVIFFLLWQWVYFLLEFEISTTP